MLGTDKREKCIFLIQIYQDIFKIVKKCSNICEINFNHFFTIYHIVNKRGVIVIFLMHILEAGTEMPSHTKAMEWSERSKKEEEKYNHFLRLRWLNSSIRPKIAAIGTAMVVNSGIS